RGQPQKGNAPLIPAGATLAGIDTHSGVANQLMLPAGATKKTVSGKYDEVTVPPLRLEAPDVELVPLTAFSEVSRRVFSKASFSTLNRIQSTVFQAAYRSNENLLICAPTGAGKTNIALMAVLHEIEQHYEEGGLDANAFKIIYVAPLKALAAEMVASFSEKLSVLGVKVRELTGDMQMTRQEIRETQMIVTTPEKWDVITRKVSDDGLVSLVRLLIIDEVHLINEDRGPVIETIVARTLRLVESSQSMIRLVGLSATLPNYRSVARFLHVNDRSVGAGGLFYFGPEYRPVPLQQTFIGIRYNDIATKNNLLNDIAFERALKAIRAGKQAMVFVHSRNDTHKSAERFAMMAAEQGLASAFA
ncbi:MAG: DEAD/DEAH box helicase, partial [Prosthecobacter sp.]|nr:DEAD/DEAH box helicase [Prosthecobacter sp.]